MGALKPAPMLASSVQLTQAPIYKSIFKRYIYMQVLVDKEDKEKKKLVKVFSEFGRYRGQNTPKPLCLL